MVILDTSIIIDHLRQKQGVSSRLLDVLSREGMHNLGISVLTIQELYRGESTRDKEKEDRLLATISPLRTMPYTYEMAKLAGELSRDSERVIEFADAAIAATAITKGALLYTLNDKDFKNIAELELFESGK